MFDRVPVYAYLLGALTSLVIGLGALYAGAARIGPVFLFGFVLLTILAAIRITTPPITSVPAVDSPSATPQEVPEAHESSSHPGEAADGDIATTQGDARDDSPAAG